MQKVNIAEINQSNTCNSQNEKLPNSNDKNDGVKSSRAFIEIYNGYGYTYDQKSCESDNIGEMVFGSVAMSFKGTSLKVTKQSKMISTFHLQNFYKYFPLSI